MARPAQAAVLARLAHQPDLRRRRAGRRSTTASPRPSCCPAPTRRRAHERGAAPRRRWPPRCSAVAPVLARAAAPTADSIAAQARSGDQKTTSPATARSSSSRRPTGARRSTLAGTTLDGRAGRWPQATRQGRRAQRLGLVVRAVRRRDPDLQKAWRPTPRGQAGAVHGDRLPRPQPDTALAFLRANRRHLPLAGRRRRAHPAGAAAARRPTPRRRWSSTSRAGWPRGSPGRSPAPRWTASSTTCSAKARDRGRGHDHRGRCPAAGPGAGPGRRVRLVRLAVRPAAGARASSAT